jgi:hypothetical protein
MADAANEAVWATLLDRLRATPFEVLYVDGEPHRVILDSGRVLRFAGNPIIRKVLDASRYTLNDVVRDYGRGSHTRDMRRLYIEIGYSVGGFLELEENADVRLSLTPDEGTA